MATGSTAVVIKAFAANVGIALAKFVVAFLSRSTAMLSEAVHSFADSGNQILLLIGIKMSKKAEDERHEFGYSKSGYFWAFIVALSLFTMGAFFSIYEGIQKIVHASEEPLGNPLTAYIVLGISTSLELFSIQAAYKEFKHFRGDRTIARALVEIRDASLVVVLFEDAAALAGLLFAFIGIVLSQLTGNAVFDGVASVMVGIVLGLVATFVALKTKDLLLGEAVTPLERQRIVQITTGSPGVRKLIHLRTMHLGPADVICAMKVAFDDQATILQIADYIDGVEERLRAAMPHLSRIYVEPGTVAEPLRPPGKRRARPASEAQT